MCETKKEVDTVLLKVLRRGMWEGYGTVALPHGWSVGLAGGSAVNTLHSGEVPVEAGLSHGTAHGTIWCHSEDGNPHPQPQCLTE